MNHIVIIGAGQAAAQAVVSLRQGGYEDAITLIGDEQELAYQRPPLSKKYLKHQEEIHFMNNIILLQELSVANTILESISGLPVEKYYPGYKKLLEVVLCY